MGRHLHENDQTTVQTCLSLTSIGTRKQAGRSGWGRVDVRCSCSCRLRLYYISRCVVVSCASNNLPPLPPRNPATCWAGVLIIRIPCIFNVLKANQLFPFPFSFSRSFTFSFHLIFEFAVRGVNEWKKNSFQIRVVFLYWLPCLLRMTRPGQETYECAPIPTGGNSEKAKQMNDVELRERYVNIKSIPRFALSSSQRLSFHSNF